MYVVIPSVVQMDTELPISARMLYGIITWKCNRRAFTWANNRELGEAMGISAKRVSALLSLLEQRGHIETEIEYRDGTREVVRRYIYPIMRSSKGILRADPPPKNRGTPPSECAYPPSEIGEPPLKNEEVICNIKNKIKINTPYSPPAGDAPADDPKPEDKPKPQTKRTRKKASVPTYAPDRFEQFWRAYPGGGSRLKAVAAWDALAPSDELIDKMALALRRQMRSRMWQEGVGIPHASTWLNQQRWTDKLPEAPPAQTSGSGGWAPDPEVES